MDPAVKKRAAVWVVWVACVLAAALALAAIVVDFLPGQSQLLSHRIADWFFTAVAVPFAVVGALIAVHRPGNRLGGLLLVGALALGAEKLAQELVQYGVGHPGAVPGLEWIGWGSKWGRVAPIFMIPPLLGAVPLRRPGAGVDWLGEQLGLSARYLDDPAAAGAVPRRPAAVPALAAACLGDCGGGAGVGRRGGGGPRVAGGCGGARD